MSTLLSAMQTKDKLTTNGMVTNSTSLNHCVDLFFNFGSMRGKDKDSLINMFVKAYDENPLTAMRLLFWVRDIRSGAGERQIFKDIMVYLAFNRTNVMGKNLSLVSEFGRWDDLLPLFGTPLQLNALTLIEEALINKDSLCSKWMPRLNSNVSIKKIQANMLRNHLRLSPKEYRKMLAENSNTVEQLMCGKEFDKIEYSKLPSKAMSDLMKTFYRNDSVRFKNYLESVDKGESKINAGAIYPYDVLKNLKVGNINGANSQWSALPNYMEDSLERLLPIVDVSGSMSCPAGGSSSITCMDVAISLGLYISERNIGPFKNSFITFSASPTLQILKGSLSERYRQLRKTAWGMNTNIEATFKLILHKAIESNVPESEMPTMIVILSDMQFDRCATNKNDTALNMLTSNFEKAGYKMPKICFWNLNSKNSDSPVRFDEKGTYLVSGFSTSILKSLLSGQSLTPLSMMMSVIGEERYSKVSI
jgi:hypothetical protein